MKRGTRFAALAFSVAFSTGASGATMTAHFIDVGQGAATLLEFHCGAVLIDAGGEQNHEFRSRDTLREYLDEFFARRTDLNGTLALVILSHPHEDHVRGVIELVDEDNEIKIASSIDNSQRPTNPLNGQRRLQRHMEDTDRHLGIRAEELPAAGLSGGLLDPFDCSNADPEFRALWGGSASEPTDLDVANNSSVVIRVDFDEISFLFLGDLDEEGEAAMRQKYAGTSLLDVDFLQASHHGAENGTSQDLLDVATPKMIFVPAGDPAREVGTKSAFSHGHPRKSAMLRFVGELTESRETKTIVVATAQRVFESMTFSKAIYGTGWDGNVRLIVNSDGIIEDIQTE